MEQCLSAQFFVNGIRANFHLFRPSDLAVFANVHLVEVGGVFQRRENAF
jgi:hypothetical protein